MPDPLPDPLPPPRLPPPTFPPAPPAAEALFVLKVSAVLEGHNDRAVGWYLRYVEVRSPNGKVGFTRDVTKAHLFTSIDEAVGYVGRTTSARRPSGMRHRPGRAYAYVVEPVLECLNV